MLFLMDEETFRTVVAAGVLLACLAFVAQAAAVVAMYRLARRSQRRVETLADKLEPLIAQMGPLVKTAGPILSHTRQILEETRPRIAEICLETLATVKAARQHVEQVGELVRETSERARMRVEQIDRAVESTVGQVEMVGGTVKKAVMRPAREVSGLMCAISAAVSTYVHGRKYSVEHATQDEEMFI